MSAFAPRPATSRRLKYVVSLRRSRVDGNEHRRPYIGLEHIESSTGRLVTDPSSMAQVASLETGEGESTSNTFEQGDVLFGKLRPYLAKAWVAEFPGRCTTELLVMQPVAADARFLRYVCLWRDFIDAVDASTFGSKMPRADWDLIGNMSVPVPNRPTQVAIADHLDRETGRLDALGAGKERVLGLLVEKRRALITRAVTRGLPAEAAAKAGLDSRVRLRDSGISWLGEIPVHWRTERLKFLVPGIEQGWSPECHSVPAADNEWGVLKAGCCNGGVFNPHENKTLPSSLEPLVEFEVKPGDVLMSRASGSTELIGSVALVPERSRDQLLLSDKIYRLSPDDRRVDRSFLVLVLGSDVGRFQVKAVVSGAAGLANNIAQTDIREFSLPLPPADEQHAIVSYITAETAKLDATHAATERTIALLKERRAALIAAAVTGQIDVGSRRHYTDDAARQKEPERRR